MPGSSRSATGAEVVGDQRREAGRSRRGRLRQVDQAATAGVRRPVVNDLGPVAERLEPGCRALRLELVARGAAAACVTGSGSAVFGLFPDLAAASAAAASLPGAAWSRAATLSAS